MEYSLIAQVDEYEEGGVCLNPYSNGILPDL